MTTEEIVRRVLTDDRHAMPPWADPVARVRAGVRRRRRRRFAVVAVACSVVVALVAVSTALAGRPVADPPPPAESTPPPEVVIPWLNRPVPRPTSYARIEPGPAPNRPCENADLSEGWVEAVRPASGPWVQTVVVKN
jgi:hypothetical protein